MKTVPTLQDLITKTAQEFEMDLSDASVMYRLEDKFGDTITVQRNEEGLLCIGEYKDFGGKLIGDPEFMIFTGSNEWVPVGFSKRGNGQVLEEGLTSPVLTSSVLASPENLHEYIASPVQEKIAEMCEAWVRDLVERNGYDGQTSFLIPSWLT